MTKKKDDQTVSFRLPPRVQKTIKDLIDEKRYLNKSDFYRTAVRNQLARDGIIEAPF